MSSSILLVCSLFLLGCVGDAPSADPGVGTPVPEAGSSTANRPRLTVLTTGDGAGQVTSADGSIVCGAGTTSCTVELTHAPGAKARVDLTATFTPSSSRFVGWSGAPCSVEPRCVLEIDRDTTVVARFAAVEPPDASPDAASDASADAAADAGPPMKRSVLTVLTTGDGTGQVTTPDGAITCGDGASKCSVELLHPEGTPALVELAAVVPVSSRFGGFTGAGCGADPRCMVEIDRDTTVIANFVAKVPLTVSFTRGRDSESTIVSTPSGLSLTSSGSDVAYFDRGTPVTVTVTSPASGEELFRFQDACQGTNGRADGRNCFLTLDGARNLTVRTARYNYAFLTSSKHDAALGGLAGADTICNTLATTAGVPGNFKALLSSSTVTARARLGASDGWRRTDDLAHIDSAADAFTEGTAKTALYVDETGAPPPGLDELVERVYTGTELNGSGSPATNFCGDWTTTVSATLVGQGMAVASNRFRLSAGAGPCTPELRFYCFGIDLTRQVPPDPLPVTTRRAFMSASPVVIGTGPAAFDQLCQNEAQAASLPNASRFKALVAPSDGVSAASRFDLTKGPWDAGDRVLLAPTASAFMSSYLWRAGIHRRANGTVDFSQPSILTGYRVIPTLEDPHPSDGGNYTCGGWLAADVGTKAGVGLFGFSGRYAMSTPLSGPETCAATTLRVYCLED